MVRFNSFLAIAFSSEDDAPLSFASNCCITLLLAATPMAAKSNSPSFISASDCVKL